MSEFWVNLCQPVEQPVVVLERLKCQSNGMKRNNEISQWIIQIGQQVLATDGCWQIDFGAVLVADKYLSFCFIGGTVHDVGRPSNTSFVSHSWRQHSLVSICLSMPSWWMVQWNDQLACLIFWMLPLRTSRKTNDLSWPRMAPVSILVICSLNSRTNGWFYSLLLPHGMGPLDGPEGLWSV